MTVGYLLSRSFQAGRGAANAKQKPAHWALGIAAGWIPGAVHGLWKEVRSEGVAGADYVGLLASSATVWGNVVELASRGPRAVLLPLPYLALRKLRRAAAPGAKRIFMGAESEGLAPQGKAADAVRLAFPAGASQSVVRFLGGLRRSAALQDRQEMQAATDFVKLLGLPSHHDPQKNWDTFKTLSHILDATRPEDPVLDAGSGGKSAILRWLTLLDYKSLHACDIRPAGNPFPNVHFQVQDLTKTNYKAASFKAIACVSVIEHGVPLDAFVAEMARLLQPGGVLAVSTDYWSEPVNCRGIYPYGEAMGEMKVLSPADIRRLCSLAEAAGLALCSPLELGTGEKAVRWERVNREYTFFFLAFRKEAVPSRPSAEAAEQGRVPAQA
jgi:SAM-dependent methyltransferase